MKNRQTSPLHLWLKPQATDEKHAKARSWKPCFGICKSRNIHRLALPLTLALTLFVIVATAIAAPPSRPLTTYGTVKINGEIAPNGTQITAQIDGTQFGATTVTSGTTPHGYLLDVVGDDPDTAVKEGGALGDVVTFAIDGREADQTVAWREGQLVRVDLSVAFATLPSADFIPTSNPADINQPVQFTDLSSDPDGTIVSWAWDFDDGNSSTQRNPSHAYTAGGTYDVSLTVTDNDGNTDTRTRMVIVNLAPPVADFAAQPTTALVNQQIDFFDLTNDIDSGIAAWGWQFGDGATSSATDPSHTYATHGVFDVTLTVTDTDGLTDTVSKPVTVLAPPVADFTATPNPARAGETIVFNQTATDPDGTVLLFDWDFGDGATNGDPNTTHSYGTVGAFYVTLVVTDSDGLRGEVTKVVTVTGPISADFTITPNPAGTNLVTQFTDQSTDTLTDIAAWQWQFGDGATSSDQNPQHVYTTFGTVVVTLTVEDSLGYTDTATQTLVVQPRPIASFDHAPITPTVGTQTQFTDTTTTFDGATATAWTWEFDDGNSSTAQNPTHTFNVVGNFNVRLTVTDTNGLSDTFVKTILVTGANQPPTATIDAPASANEGATIELSAASSSDTARSVVDYLWDLDDDGAFDDATGVTTTVSFPDDGAFTVRVRVVDNEGGRTDAAAQIAVQNVAPVVTATANVTTEVGIALTLDATFSDVGILDTHSANITWGDGAQTPLANVSSPFSATHTYNLSGDFTATICVTDDDGGEGCTDVAVHVDPTNLIAAQLRDGLANDADSSGDVSPGDTLAYTLTVENVGGLMAQNVTITDTFDSALQLDGGSIRATKGTGEFFADSFEINVGSLALGERVTVTFEAMIANPLPIGRNSVSNQATISGGNFVTVVSDDPDTAERNDPTTTPVTVTTDLQLTTTDNATIAFPSEYLVYRLTVTNTGNGGLTDVALTGTVPERTTFRGADYGGSRSGSVVTWSIDSIGGGETVQRILIVQVNGTVPTSVQTFTHVAEIAAQGLTVTDTTTVGFAPDLTVVDMTTGAQADPQSLLLNATVPVDLSNIGNLDASDPFSLTVFADLNRDGVFDGGDTVLGASTIASLNDGATATSSVALNGTLPFRNAVIYGMVDSGMSVLEQVEGNNVGNSADSCQSTPQPHSWNGEVEFQWPTPHPKGEVEPITDFAWRDSYQSSSTPIVANMNDDNGDGLIDDRDHPDLVITTYRWVFVCDPLTFQCFIRIDQHRIRVIDGATGDLLYTIAPNNQYLNFSRSSLAVGDVDDDGKPEIVVPDLPYSFFSRNRFFVYEHDGTFKYTSQTYRARPAGVSPITRYSQPSIADLDGDGTSEIVIGATAFNGADGVRLWERHLGMGYAGRDAAISVVADIDFDDKQEIITGNTIYRHDGSIYWHDETLLDGYPAVGNFDSDPFLEFVVVRGDEMRIHDHDGTLRNRRTIADTLGVPTVANFDNDAQSEIALIGSSGRVAVFDSNTSFEWDEPVNLGSQLPGVAAFDFDGNGRYEVVARDRTGLRIYDGANGTVLFESQGSASTYQETPTVADWDGDGSAEIITTHDHRTNSGTSFNPITGITTYGGSLVRAAGVRVIGNPSWQDTFSTWQQHAYIAPFDGLTPELTRAQPPLGVANASADLSLSFLRLDSDDFPISRIVARVGNGGSATVNAGVPVRFYDGDPNIGGTYLGMVATSLTLGSGDFEDVIFTLDGIITENADIYAVVDEANEVVECREDNNAHQFTYDVTDLGLAAHIDNGITTVNNGDTITYTLLFANLTLAPISDTVVQATVSDFVNILSISDGGSDDGNGNISFPALTMPASSFMTRTVVAQVDPAIPLTTRLITGTISVDGALDDPTPSNNSDEDVDRVLTVAAKPGGPYIADEGDTVILDASASYDRNGVIDLYEWDTDGDGIYETTGVTATITVNDNRDIPLKLRVTDNSGEVDVDSTRLTFRNVLPVVNFGADRTGVEGSIVAITPTLFSDVGLEDTHTVFVDWGDGFSNAGTVSETLGAGEAFASHVYPDDGVYTANVCVIDDDGGATCDDIVFMITNAAPDFELGFFDLRQWTHEDSGGSGTANWEISADGQTVTETINNGPTFYYGPFSAFGNRSEVIIRVAQSGDNDYIGFVLGFAPNDSVNPDADYLLLSWKQGNQTASYGSACGNQFAADGLALSRVRGVPNNAEFWGLNDLDCAPDSSITQLARGETLFTTGWQDHRAYHFRFEYSPTRVKIWVDDVLQFDVEGDFPPGRLGYYNYSQANVVYQNVYLSEIHVNEGELIELVAPFGDRGSVDTHTVAVDWQDGTQSGGTVGQFEFGGGLLTTTHRYQDNGDYLPLVCVTDDENDTDCDTITATVRNVAPTVFAGVDLTQQVTEAVTLDLATLFDPGALDTFTVTVDWGDGVTDTGSFNPTATSATGVEGDLTFPSHTYSVRGLYTVEVCAVDDDGGVGCDELVVNLGDLIVDIEPAEIITEGVETMFTAVYSDFVAAQPYTFTWQIESGWGRAFQSGTVTRSHTFADDGVYSVRLTVENNDGEVGFAVLPVTVNNALPIVDAGADITVTETSPISLAPTTFSDLGVEDTHTAIIDWGDGEGERGNVTTVLGAGTVNASHTYADDGVYSAEICVTDKDGATGCDTLTITVENAPPVIEHHRFVDLRDWTVQRWGGNANWQILDDGLTARQTQDTNPSILHGIPLQDGLHIATTLQFEPDNDNDFGGFVIGIDAGEQDNPLAEFYIIDWRQTNQLASTCRGGDQGNRGLALSRAFGVPAGGEFWHHSNVCDSDDAGLEPLARALTLGSAGYTDGVDYRFEFAVSKTELRVWVDGVLEFDQLGDFTGGEFGFYTLSQDRVRFSEVAIWYPEGSEQQLVTLFSEINPIDTHTTTVQWAENPTQTVAHVGNVFTDTYTFADNGDYAIRTCAEDDDGGRDCRTITATVQNLPPIVVASADQSVSPMTPFTVQLARFGDAGSADTHTVVIDWGDGNVVTRSARSIVTELISDSHQYTMNSVYTVTVTVIDDDGGVGQDSLLLNATTSMTAVGLVAQSSTTAARWPVLLSFGLLALQQLALIRIRRRLVSKD